MTDPEHPDAIRRTREVLAYRNRYIDVYDDEVAFPSGSAGNYLRIQARDEGLGVVIVPVHDQFVGLVRTYRYPLGRPQWGLPRGFSQSPDPLVTARAELHEELGVPDAEFHLLGTMTPDSSLLGTTVAVVHAAVPALPGSAPLDLDEVTGTRWLPLPDLPRWITTGHLDDGMTLAALTLARAHGRLP
ncbi:NUDIX hydrolase [Kitasatospora cheerisanensis]|uniref:NUDIX hydrolase n=1 Tax=Kitasatospora cheerisanensis KCTC 2395 TaxID=1348663 RepID=A0A066Z1G9_9ACTN|nr:NUDIX hydrolase [Kitasatospora cheerisanensis]KDN84025.1 NUDIX hydrolase [Kitasatospora cheerisanensis KCTC 2395]